MLRTQDTQKTANQLVLQRKGDFVHSKNSKQYIHAYTTMKYQGIYASKIHYKNYMYI